MNSRKESLVENLTCRCVNNVDYDRIRDCITLRNFATAIGGELHMSPADDRVIKALSDYNDFLPGGSRELGYRYAAKEFIEDMLEMAMYPVANKGIQFTNTDVAKEVKYFICKSCCPVCRTSTRGCPLHCCKTCWASLHKLDQISKDLTLTRRSRQLKKKQITDFIHDVVTDVNIVGGSKLTPSQGYLHNDLDIALYLYKTYEMESAEVRKLIQ